jgi:hypothetical protein
VSLGPRLIFVESKLRLFLSFVSREASAGSLQPLYEFVREALKPVDHGEATWRCPVLLVDDLSVLLSLGLGAVAVLDFIHYCRATVCWELKVLKELLPLLPPGTSKSPGRPRLACLQSLFTCLGFGYPLAGPKAFWFTHFSLPYLLLLKNKSFIIKGKISTVFSEVGHVWHFCSPNLCVLG